MRISIITPSRNAESLIARTVRSIVEQNAVLSGDVELQYVLCDGASSDRTVELAKAAGGDAIDVISRPDTGMYDALATGLRVVTGEWISYVNAGDELQPGALEAVRKVEQGSRWITGRLRKYDKEGRLVADIRPYRYLPRLIRTGFYTRRAPFFLPWIQQEAIFWRRELHSLVDLDRLATFRYAGDAYLWHCFSSQEELRIIDAVIGSFQVHAGQLSENQAAYRSELRQISDPTRVYDYLLALSQIPAWWIRFHGGGESHQ
jgi:glycosyltransferase involved in cell wall biosynthesis